jgi:hypothetical protein
MARRRRAKNNPSTGFWIAVGVGVVAVGGVAYVMTRPTTASAATPTPAPVMPPTNDAAVLSPGASFLVNTPGGQTINTTLAQAMSNALLAASAGQLREGQFWANTARAHGATVDQLTQLSAAGY